MEFELRAFVLDGRWISFVVREAKSCVRASGSMDSRRRGGFQWVFSCLPWVEVLCRVMTRGVPRY